MKKNLIMLLTLCLITGCTLIAKADDDDWDDDDYNKYHHCYGVQCRYHYDYDDDDDYKDWRDSDDYDKWKERRYKNWYKRCYRYGGRSCSYSRWHNHQNWEDRDWDEYWRTNHSKDYERYERARNKAGAVHRVINATREFFYY